MILKCVQKKVRTMNHQLGRFINSHNLSDCNSKTILQKKNTEFGVLLEGNFMKNLLRDSLNSP